MCGAGRRTLIFPITFRRTIVGQCRIREQTEILVLFQRENLFSLRGFITQISESYSANKSVVIQKGGREIPSWVAREHRATTIPNEMRHVERARAVAVQLSSEMTDGEIIIHILCGVESRSGVVTREIPVCAITICSVSRRTLSTLTESGCLSSVRDLYLLRNKQAAGRSIKSVGCEPRS